MSARFADRANYLPLNDQDYKGNGIFCVIPFRNLAWGTVSLPFFAFFFCVVWSIIYHFDTTVATHCRVANFLPSISAAIGNESPQQEIWQLFIALHAPTRFLVVWMYRGYYLSVLQPSIHWLSDLNCLLNVVENIALLGLTFVSSSYHYPTHEKFFITFIITSEMYMLICCYLLSNHRAMPANNIEARSLRWKRILLTVNVLSIIIAGYFFLRHNWYCEPWVYSIFALFEYTVVVTNMGFHMTAYYDLFDRKINFGRLSQKHFITTWIS